MLAAREDVRYIDANVDRIFISSTAETHPEGTFFFSDYNLILLQFGYAITDTIQLSLTGVPPLVDGQPYFFDLASKFNLLRSQFRFAAQAALDIIFADTGTAGYETFWFARVGGAGTLCFTDDCWSHANASFNIWFNDDVGDTLPMLVSLGVVGRLSELIALMGEAIFITAIGGTTDVFNRGFIFDYGLRISGARWALDIGFFKYVQLEDDFEDPLILGWPLVAFTYRTEGSVAGGEPAAMAPPAGNQTARDIAIRSYVPF